jgi:hypothetical protein
MTGIGTTSATKAIASPALSSKDLGQMMTNECDVEHGPAEEYAGAVLMDRPSTSAKSLSEVVLPPSLEHLAI